MSTAVLVARSLRYYWRFHVCVALGAACATAALTGALLAGDSIRRSLFRLLERRLGRVTHAIHTGNRLFSADLADRLSGNAPSLPVAPVLALRGSLRRIGSAGEALGPSARVDVLAVDERFWAFSLRSFSLSLAEGEAAVNERVARELTLSPGDGLALRVIRPAQLSRDAPLSSRKDTAVSVLPLRVVAIVPDDALGRWSLTASVLSPRNVFVSQRMLQQRLGVGARVNSLLVSSPEGGDTMLGDHLRRSWELSDVGLRLRTLDAEGIVQLESDGVFIDPWVGETALTLPGVSSAVGTLTYLVNAIASETTGRATPYSFVIACSPCDDTQVSPIPPGWNDTDIVINSWVADRLGVSTGAPVTLSYAVLQPNGDFAEATRRFVVRRILGMEACLRERDRMPVFPGLSDVDSCREWDVGLPMDENKLQDPANEEYWKQYRQTPKAFVSLAAGRTMWENRFGYLMAVRYPLQQAPSPDTLRQALQPETFGLVFQPVRAQGWHAVHEADDLGNLLLGMSTFLILSALILTGLLFAFGVAQRSRETGILLAVGYTRGKVIGWVLREGAIVALCGAVAGAGIATGYMRFLLAVLRTVAPQAVDPNALTCHAAGSRLAFGAVAGFSIALMSLMLTLRGHFRAPLRVLLTATPVERRLPGTPPVRSVPPILRAGAWVGVVFSAGLAVVAHTVAADRRPVCLLIAGSFLLAGGLGWIARVLSSLAQRPMVGRRGSLGFGGTLHLAARQVSRRLARSLTLVALMSVATFLIVTSSVAQPNIRSRANRPAAGTGGFDFLIEPALPLPYNPGVTYGRTRLALDADEALQGMEYAPFKVRDGDEAGCSNLHQPQTPRLLGADVSSSVLRAAFARGSRTGPDPWKALERLLADGAVPALTADTTTRMWGLKRKGRHPVFEYRDERGMPFRVRVVGSLPVRVSVLQGSLIISDRFFVERFPSEEGFRLVLARTSAPNKEAARKALRARLEPFGADVWRTADRLAELAAVEGAYRSVFFVLGGMALLLGTFGLAAVVLRNLAERRREWAVLMALGFRPAELRRLVMAEQALLLVAGLGLGIVASCVALIPSAGEPGGCVPFFHVALAGTGILASGLGAAAMAARRVARESPARVLRNE